MSNIFEQKFWNIYQDQPEDLPYLEKLIRIDKLTNYEVAKQLSICNGLQPRWYFSLGILLTQEYLRLVPKVREFKYLGDIVREQLRAHTEQFRSNGLTELLRELTLKYVQWRQELVKFLEARHD